MRIFGGEWRTILTQVSPIKFLFKHFIGAIVNFIIIALIVFLLMKQLSKTESK